MYSLIIVLLLQQPSPEAVYKECVKQNVQFPLIVTAQSILECGWKYDSYNARIRKNLFGLRNANNVSENNPKGYYKFDTWQKSVKKYVKYFQYRYKSGDYWKFLELQGYSESSKYIKLVKSILNKLKKLWLKKDIYTKTKK